MEQDNHQGQDDSDNDVDGSNSLARMVRHQQQHESLAKEESTDVQINENQENVERLLFHGLRHSQQIGTREDGMSVGEEAAVAESLSLDDEDVEEWKDPNEGQNGGVRTKSTPSSREAFLKLLATTKPHRGRVLIDFGIRTAMDDLWNALMRRRPIQPSSRLRIVWDSSLMFFICYGLIMIPYDIAFYVDANPWMVINVLIDAFFIFDVYLNFHTAYLGEDNDIVTDFDMIRNHYLRTWFFIDLLASLPFGSLEYDPSPTT